MEANPITTIPNLPPLKLPSTSQTADLQHLHTLLHLLHHRNHNQHRRSTWYRHFNIFRRHLATILTHLSTLAQVPTTHLARHKKKAEDEASRLRIQQTLAFWRDVLAPKCQHAFGQLIADGRFAVLGVVLMAVLGNVCRVFGLVGVYEELGEEETRRVLGEFAAENWGEEEGLGVPVSRDGEKREDLGEVLERGDNDDTDDEPEARAKKTEKELRKVESGCLAPERDMLDRSRKALKAMANSTPILSASDSDTPPPKKKTSKKLKLTDPISKQRPTKILPAVNWDDNSTMPLPKPSNPITSTSTTSSKPKTKRPKKKEDNATGAAEPIKKKRKKNAIDDLFAGW